MAGIADIAQGLMNGQNPEEFTSGAEGREAVSNFNEIEDSQAVSEVQSVEGLIEDQLGIIPDTNNVSENDAGDTSLSSNDSDSQNMVDGPTETSEQGTVTVTDSKGRRKVKVDYSDRKKMDQYVKMAYGMRKFQAERDASNKQWESLGGQEVAAEKVNLFNQLDDVYQNAGVEGLINRLEGSDDAYATFKQQVIEEHEARRSASPAEIARMDALKDRDRLERELNQIKARQETLDNQTKESQAQSEAKALQAQVNSVFEKYRFNGKLDDADQEHKLDKAIWSAARDELEQLEEDGIELTASVIEKTIREVAVPFRKYINKQSRVKLKKAIARQKDNAASDVQAQLKSKMGSTSNAKLAESLRNGTGTSMLLDLWGKSQKK